MTKLDRAALWIGLELDVADILRVLLCSKTTLILKFYHVPGYCYKAGVWPKL